MDFIHEMVTMLKGNKVIINCKKIVKCVFRTYINAIYAAGIKNDRVTEMLKAIFPSPNTDPLNN